MSVKTELSKSNADEISSILNQDCNENLKEDSIEKNSSSLVLKEKYGISLYSKSSCYSKTMKLPHSKRKFVPVSSCLTDASAKFVLSERNVEIKDLESKVKFLKSKIKELEDENKTLQNVHSRQERELKKFKEGITDIPALLKSHKEEIKVYISTISIIRKELRAYQKELKLRNESLLKKENQIDKLNINLKQSEKINHEYSSEIKKLKAANKDLEEENKVLLNSNENLKKGNDDLCKEIKDLMLEIKNLQESLNEEKDLNKNLNCELNGLKENYEKDLIHVINQNIQSCENQILSEVLDDVASKPLDIVSPVKCMEKEIEKMENSSLNGVDEQQNLCSIKSVNKTKDALIHNFKSYQQFCNSQLKNTDARVLDIGLNNIKLLPPIKTPSKESSSSIKCDLGKRECSSSFDINFSNEIKNYLYDVSANDSRKQFNAIYEGDRFLCEPAIREDGNFLHFSLNDNYKECHNHEFKNNVKCSKKPDVSEINAQNSCFLSRDITETKNRVNFGKSLKVSDNFFSDSLNKRVQKNILENNNVPGENLEKGKYNCFEESSKNMSKYWKNSMHENDFEYTFGTDEVNNPKYRSTF